MQSSHSINLEGMATQGEIELFDDCFVDILSFTKRDWDVLETLAMTLRDQNMFGGNDFKCTIAALALYLDSGHGLRQADQ